MLYPLLFTPIHKKMIWGSERWDITCRFNKNEMSIIENGPLAGTSLGDVYEKDFPLLVKIIEAKDNLSIQVHPDDNYAAEHGFESGKSEMWYIMDAPPDAHLIVGLADGTTPEMLLNDPMNCLNKLPVKKGDIVDIPAGLVHAITKGIKLAEIQQNCDVTFRLYDYGRLGQDGKPRQLHLKDGIAATDFGKRAVVSDAVSNRYFSVVKIEVDGSVSEISGGSVDSKDAEGLEGSAISEGSEGLEGSVASKDADGLEGSVASDGPDSGTNAFTIYTCVEGSCVISSGSSVSVELSYSRSVFIPAGLGPYTITGRAVLLKTTSKPTSPQSAPHS